MGTSEQELSLLTYNLHGFNQGESFLIDACSSHLYDVIFVQEHWLGTDNICKLSGISNDYVAFGESAMSKKTSSGILYGRPFGGVATLVSKSLCGDTKCVFVGERIVAVNICGALLINVYFPCDDGSLESYDLVVEMLSTIECIITDNISSCKALFIGGDFNTDLNLNRRNALLLKDFLVEYDMKFLSNTDGVNNYSVSHTFSNEKRNCSSIIDFICFSSGLLPHVSAYTIIEDSVNLSDHEPLNLTLITPTSVDIGSALAACRSGAIVNVVKGQQSPIASPPNLMNTNSQYGTRHSPKGYSLRFDRGNIAGYYECTRVKLQPILEELTRATHALNDSYVGVRTTLHLAISPI